MQGREASLHSEGGRITLPWGHFFLPQCTLSDLSYVLIFHFLIPSPILRRKESVTNILIENCNGLNVCIPLKFICRNLIPSNSIWRRGLLEVIGAEGGVLINAVCALKTPKRAALNLLLCDDTARRQSLPVNQEAGSHQTLSLSIP